MTDALDLMMRLANIADALVESRATQIGDAAIRILKEEVETARRQISEAEYLVSYEATCLIECIAELAYARTDRDQRREERAMMYLNSFRTFVRIDVERLRRKAMA